MYVHQGHLNTAYLDTAHQGSGKAHKEKSQAILASIPEQLAQVTEKSVTGWSYRASLRALR